MLDKSHFKDMIVYVLVIGIFILAGWIIKPVVIPIIYGILLGYIFYPVYKKTVSKLRNENLSAFLVCMGILVIIIGLAAVFLTSLSKQLINIYFSLQRIDLVHIITENFPNFLSSSELSETIIGSLNTYVSTFLANSLGNVGTIILNLPVILLKLFVVIFIFYFSLRDGERAIDYIKSLSPLKKETNERFSKEFKDITNSVLVGQIVVGVLQGLIAGIGYFVFGVPNAILLTILTILIGIIPLIGPWLVWIPVDVFLFATGRSGAAIGLLIYGLILVNWVDTVIRPLIVSRKTKINSGIVIIGMIGGIFVLGVLGLIIGPLVLAYVLLILELYRKKGINENILFIKREE